MCIWDRECAGGDKHHFEVELLIGTFGDEEMWQAEAWADGEICQYDTQRLAAESAMIDGNLMFRVAHVTSYGAREIVS